MTLSPEQMEKLIGEAAKLIAEQAIKEAGGAAKLVVFPLSAICQMTGLSRHTVPLRMPITQTTQGKHGVTLENLQAYLDGNTVWPGRERMKGV